ncbi:hypothetical protein ACFRJ1_06390 [Streptomyces sp. NPDC056773]|uniref:hypothetical protein n=1 Tax=unclassified Streptomyces TaxID=2593676 RepID=UPI0036BC03AE
MWEIAPSFRLLRSAAAHPVHRPWADQVRPRMVAAGLDRGWLCELIPPTGGYVPDFLNPAPLGPAPTPAAERDAIRAASADRVRQDLDHLAHHQGRLGPRLRALHNDPQGLLAKVAEELETYWELALAPTGHASGQSWTQTSSTGPAWPPSTASATSSTTCTRP